MGADSAELEHGRPLCDICPDDDMPGEHGAAVDQPGPRGFCARYAQAREIGRPPLAEIARSTPPSSPIGCSTNGGSRTLTNVCDDPGMPSRSTVRLWVREDREGFACVQQARSSAITVDRRHHRHPDDGRHDWMERRRKDGSAFVPKPRNIKRSGCAPNVRCGCCRMPCRDFMAMRSKVPRSVSATALRVDEAFAIADEAELGHVRVGGRGEHVAGSPAFDPSVLRI